jgi:hypothetical protein
VRENGIPVWDKTFTPNEAGTYDVLTVRNARAVKDISFIPLKDTITQEIKSFIAAYKVDNNSVGYRLYNKKALLNYFPPNNTIKEKVISMLVVHAFFEDNINGKKKMQLPAPYNNEVSNAKIKIKKTNDLTTRLGCYEVCIDWNAPIALMPLYFSNCYTVCTYDGPITDISNYGGNSACSLCSGNGLGSTGTSTSSGGGSSSGFTALDGLIYNGSLLSDLSAALDPDGMPLADFQSKFPDYVHLVAPLRELKQKLGDLDRSDLEMYVRNPNIITEAINFFNKYGVNEQTRAFERSYNELFKTDEEFKAMVTTTIPPFVWDIAFDIGLEVVEKLAKKMNPAFELTDDIKNIIQAVRASDWKSFLFELGKTALDVAKNSVGVLKVIDAGLETSLLVKKLYKIKEPLEEIYNKVDAATFQKLYAAMSKLTNRNVFDKFGTFVYPDGSKHLQFNGSTKDLFNTIRSEFGVSISYEAPPKNGIYFEVGDMRLTWYPVSNTNDKPTIEIKKGNTVIMKIRQP